ncbi:MAG: shikimate kinase [Acidobacteriota bacterium]
MDGYYDYGPVISLDRHVVLGGYLPEETRMVAYRAAALLGLSAVDIDRNVEHDAGCSIWDLIWNSGEEAYRRLEAKHLRRALETRPFSMISLGDGALIDEASQTRVRELSHSVVLDVDLANCFWRLKGTDRAATDYWHPLYAGPLERIDQVRPFYQRRRPGMDHVAHRLPLGGTSAHRAVDTLVSLVKSFETAA